MRILLSALIISAAALSFAEEVVEDRFEQTTVLENLIQPMQFVIGPDKHIYYIELNGKLKIFRPETRDTVEALSIDVFTDQENGLLGLALDPNFKNNGWIYLHYSPKKFTGHYISRFTLSGGKIDLNSEKILLSFGDQRRECCHHAGPLRFAPDGCLFIATGDNTHPGGDSDGFAPIDERKDKEPFDAQKSASNTHDLRGKILRVKPNADGTITIPDGNLFPKDGSQGRPEIYVMGCRNPWRIDVDSKTGFLYWGEVGPDAGKDGPRGSRGYDEINQARKPGNFGWPYFVGGNYAYARYDFATKKVGEKYDPLKPVNESVNNTGSKVLPPAQPAWIYYPYAKSEKFPEVGEGGRTACAGPVYHFDSALQSPTKLPDHYDNCLFIYEWSRHWIKAVKLDDGGAGVPARTPVIEPFAKSIKLKRPIDIHVGPEGALYVLEYGETWGVNKDARLSRIDYVRGNRAPIARAKATNNIGKQPLKVSFSAKASSDKDTTDVLLYEWKNGNTGKILSKEREPVITFDEPGAFTIELTVTDPHGATGRDSVPVLIGNSIPQVSFKSPPDGGFFDWQKPITYELKISDAEDGTSDDRDDAMAARTVVDAKFTAGPPPNHNAASNSSDPLGLQLMKKSDCFNCHAIDRKVVGPAYVDIAKKYHGDSKALEASAQRVVAGSTGVWDQMPMLPHPQHTLDETRQMVAWVFSLAKQEQKDAFIFKGFSGYIPTPTMNKKETDMGTFVLRAAYSDAPVKPVGSLSGFAEIVLRTRRVEAEHFSEKSGALKPLDSKTSSSDKFIGAIDDQNFLRFNGLNLEGINSIKFRVGSGGAGANMELHADSPIGALICSVEVKQTGGWEKWVELDAAVTAPGGKHDVYVVFLNKGKSGLMNLDWMEFNGKKQ